MSQPYAKNMSVEYAQKAIPGGELQKSIDNTLNAVTIPVLTEDNALEIFANKPKFIQYSDAESGTNLIYILQDTSDTVDVYYVSNYLNNVYSIAVSYRGSIEVSIETLAKAEDIKPIYYHPVIIIANTNATLTGRISLWIINNDSTPFTKDTFKAYLRTLNDSKIRLNVTGALKDVVNDDVVIMSDVSTYQSTDHRLRGVSTTGLEKDLSFETLLNMTECALFDPVNRIN